MIKKTFALVFILCIVSSVILAQTSNLPLLSQAKPGASAANAGGATPTKEEIDAALKRNLGYDPAVKWTIYDIRPSPIPGVADVLVSISKGEQSPAQHIYVSMETQNAIGGEMIPFGPDPFAPARSVLRAADGPALGSQTPSIVIVEFSDLECPHCKAAQPIAEKLAADFPQVRYVFQQFPLPATMHPWALKAAEYADCVSRQSPTNFWKYVDTVFENQGSIAAATAEDKLKEFATTLGIDAAKISSCASLPQTEARIKKSLQLGESLDVTQTPTMFINGRRVLAIADLPYDQLKSIVQFEIDHPGK